MKPIIATLALSALLISVTAQEPNPKYRPAPPGAKGVKTDQFCVSFKQELSKDELIEAVERITVTYQARPMPSDVGLNGKAIYYSVGQRCACLYVSEENAKQIAAREEVVETVTQDFEPQIFIDPYPRYGQVRQGPPRPGKIRPPEDSDRSKFQLASAGTPGVRPDQYVVEFKWEVQGEDFERELSRILEAHNAEVLRDQGGRQAELRFAEYRLALIRCSEKDARAIAEDGAVRGVRQLTDRYYDRLRRLR